MPGDQFHAATGHLVGDGDRLFRVARVVADKQLDLLAEHAALGVNVGDRLFGAGFHLGAEACVLSGHRADDRDLHVRLRHACADYERRGCRGSNMFYHPLRSLW